MKSVKVYAGLIILAVILAAPVIILVITSFTPYEEIFSETPGLLPSHVTIQWYQEILVTTPIVGSILNSLVVAVGTMIVNIVVSSLAGYSLSRFNYPGKQFLGRMVIFTYMLPPILLVLPLYLIIAKLGLLNTHLGLIITHTTFTVPFSIWLLKSYFDTIPVELDECALIDGGSRMQAFVWIVAPLARSGLAAAATYTYIISWNEYLYSSVLMTSYGMKTLPVKISEFIVETSEIRWGAVMAAATLALIPATLLFQFVQQAFIKGLTAGAVKG